VALGTAFIPVTFGAGGFGGKMWGALGAFARGLVGLFFLPFGD